MNKKSILELVGKTPVVKLDNIDKNISELYVKLEGKNPGGSVKDRAVLGMIEDALNNGKIKKGYTIIEPTSGNTGISLAMIGKKLGFDVEIIMPESMSLERRNIIKSYGAKLILTPADKGMKGAIEKAEEILNTRKNYYMLNQFSNSSNYEYHYKTTGPEIYDALGDIDIFVAGVGTGGTISGVSKYLKEKNKNIIIVAVEPESSPVLTKGEAGAHKIQGIGAGFIPKNYLAEYIDKVIAVSDEDAFKYTKILMEREGIFSGLSTGANLVAVLKVAEEYGHDKKILFISPDGGEKYISTGVFLTE